MQRYCMLSRQSFVPHQTNPLERWNLGSGQSLHFQVKSRYIMVRSQLIVFFSAVEISAGIICSSLPILVALFHNHAHPKSRFPFPKFLSSRLFSRKSRRALILDQTPSFDHLYPSKHADSAKQEAGDYVQLESGSSFVKTNNATRVLRVS